MTDPETTITEHRSVFHVPRTLEEIVLAIAFVAWPFIYVFVLRPRDVNVFWDVLGLAIAVAGQVGLAVAMRNVRRRA